MRFYTGWANRRHCAVSFDDLVGADEKRRRKGEAESPGDLEIYDQIESVGLLDWEVFGPGTPQDFGGEAGKGSTGYSSQHSSQGRPARRRPES
jgi:hypothetical protein